MGRRTPYVVAMQDGSGPERVLVRFKLRLAGRSFDAEARVPREPIRVVDLLPVLQPLAAMVVEAALPAAGGGARALSCRAGCGACCRQPVPIAESEAVLLAELIAGLPERRRRVVEARFDAALQELERHDLLGRLRALCELEDAEERQRLASEYFRLGIACPFLERESCSIHPSRPMACREYWVTSPVQWCSDPTPERVEMVPIPVRPSVALFRFGAGRVTGPARSLALVLVREWCAAHPDAAQERYPGPALFENFVRGLAGEGE